MLRRSRKSVDLTALEEEAKKNTAATNAAITTKNTSIVLTFYLQQPYTSKSPALKEIKRPTHRI